MRAATATVLVAGGLAMAPAAQAACNAPAPNAIAAENALTGSPSSEWDLPAGTGDANIQGFATDISVNCGDTVHFKVDTTASSYRLDIYRMGYYGGDGARKVATVNPSAALPQSQPPCNPGAAGLVDCGNWAESASWSVPSTAVSGIYFAHLVSAAGQNHIFFVVRNDSSTSDIDFQTSDTTWQAYNRYGGNSLYTGGPLIDPPRAAKVSYNRPFTTREYSPEDWVFNAEYPMVRWLERNGYDVSYTTGVDTDRDGAAILRHKTFLSVGHDEYWSGTQRANVEAARDAGVNLAFFSGNEVFWKTRWEDNHRTLVSYKETHANQKLDTSTSEWTGTWRDPRPFNPQGGRPENALTGTLFTVNSGTPAPAAIEVPAEDGKLRLWRGTAVAAQAAGTTMSLTPDTLGYEWDEDVDNGARPAGLVELSSATFDVGQKLQDYGSNYGQGIATHHLTLYRDTNGAGRDALVFGAGTVQWSWGLDAVHDRGSAAASPAMQQATVNLMADMGAQPATLQAGMTAATASTDTVAPSSSITSPAAGAAVPPGTSVIRGTAVDAGGGRVGAVEVSVDGGATWHPATGRESWQYLWTPSSAGPATVLSRAADDSGNLGSATSVTVGVGSLGCPCTLFGDAPLGASSNDGLPIEVGVRFRADDDGFVTALRYYRGAGDTSPAGSRVGHLWRDGGTTPLAGATFVNDSQPGWHEVALSAPVSVSKGTTYVASYLSSDGSYSAVPAFFNATFDAAPLHAPAGPNGVYVYGGGLPTQTTTVNANYGADVVFLRTDQTPPTITGIAPTDGAGAVDPGTQVTAVFNEPLNASTVVGATFLLRDGAGAVVPADVAYDAATRTAILKPKAPLAGLITYRATIKGGAVGVSDAAGNALAQDRTWSFTTALPLSGPTLGGESSGSISRSGGSGSGAGTHGSASGGRAGPRVAVTPRTVRASKTGTVSLRVACPRSARSCRTQVSLQLGRRTVAAKTLTVAGGKARLVTLKLDRSARRDLLRKRSLQVIAIVTARDKTGSPATSRTAIRLLAPSRR